MALDGHARCWVFSYTPIVLSYFALLFSLFLMHTWMEYIVFMAKMRGNAAFGQTLRWRCACWPFTPPLFDRLGFQGAPLFELIQWRNLIRIQKSRRQRLRIGQFFRRKQFFGLRQHPVEIPPGALKALLQIKFIALQPCRGVLVLKSGAKPKRKTKFGKVVRFVGSYSGEILIAYELFRSSQHHDAF